jgi:hypothetical protein
MKISKLIETLTAIQQKYGDLDVVCYKNQNYVDDLEKLVRFEAFRHTGAVDARTTTPEERALYRRDPSSQPNAGWLVFDESVMDRKQFADRLETKLFLGPKVTVSSNH